jgi:VanZ family protein
LVTVNSERGPAGLPRHRHWWLLGGYLVLLLVLAMALLPGRSLPEVEVSDKLLHGLTFAFLMLWFSALYPLAKAWRVALALLGYGVAMELLQGLSGQRSAELGDLLADAIGIAAGWLLAWAGLHRWCRWLELRLAGATGS